MSDGPASHDCSRDARAHRKLHVLVVDDEEGVLHVVDLALDMAGHRASCFDTAAAASAAFDASPDAYDAAVLDQNLKDGTGLDLAAHMRLSNSAMQIILVSGQPNEKLREAAKRLNVRVLPKPFSVEGLQACLELDLDL